MVLSSDGLYVPEIVARPHDNVQDVDVKPSCVVVSESDPCPHGEFVPKSMTLDIPPHSRTIDGHVYNSQTTPKTCPPEGWFISDVHTFSDGTKDTFVNPNPVGRERRFRCRRMGDPIR